MNQQLSFPRPSYNVLASADDIGVMVIAGWTVSIPKASAIQYAKTFDSNTNAGFFKHDGKIVLSHGAAKIWLSEQEARAIVDLITAAYAPF